LLREPISWVDPTDDRLFVRAAASAIALLLAVGALLVWRRFWGALDSSLSLTALLITALFLTTIVSGVRVLWRRRFPVPESRSERQLDQFIGLGGSAALIIIAVGCCYPGDRNGEWLIWLPLVIADQFWRQSFFDNGLPGRLLSELADSGDSDLDRSPIATEPLAHRLQDLAPAKNSTSGDINNNQFEQTAANATWSPSPDCENLLQQLFRVRLESGDEAIYGTLRADFLKDQRNATLHVGFCPPLARRPEIEADACRRGDVKIKVVQALAHGVRIDVRLGSPAAEPQSVEIDLAALPSAVQPSAVQPSPAAEAAEEIAAKDVEAA
jgi:hypothetical protein